MSKMKAITIPPGGITGPAIFKNKYLDMSGRNTLTFTDCEFLNSGQIFGDGAHHIVFERCRFIDLNPANEIFCQLKPGNDYWVFDSCEWWGCGDAIYAKQVDGHGGEYLWVKDCQFRQIGTLADHPSKDGHCVGWQAWSHVTIQRCTTYDTGSPFSAWSPQGVKLTDALLEDNVSYAVRKAPWMQTNGNGVEFSGSHPLGERKNLGVWRHKVYDAHGYGLSSNSALVLDGIETCEFHDCKQGKMRIHDKVIN